MISVISPSGRSPPRYRNTDGVTVKRTETVARGHKDIAAAILCANKAESAAISLKYTDRLGGGGSAPAPALRCRPMCGMRLSLGSGLALML